MGWYPVQLNLQGKRCIVVGGGKVAERKVQGLLASGAEIWVIAPEVTPALRQWADNGTLRWTGSSYQSGHLVDALLVIAATDRAEVNAAVARDAEARGVLVCTTDDVRGGNFATPASVTRGELVWTVFTGGSGPTLAAVLREALEATYGPEWEVAGPILAALRPTIQALGNERARKEAVRHLLADEGFWDALRRGQIDEAEAWARECLCLFSE